MLSLRKNCPEEIADLAELYLLNRLPAEDNCKVEEHLLSCSRCMEILEETEQFLIAFRGARERMNADMAPVPINTRLARA
jgi:hypothetical protein